VERNIYVVLVPNKLAIQKEQDGLNKKDTVKEEKDQTEDQSDVDEPVTEKLEESKEPEAEVSANV
jgi:translation initiation factor IF-3